MLTLGAAARHCGVSKGTISRAIASGKLLATQCKGGSWAIDGAELAYYLKVNGHRFRADKSADAAARDDILWRHPELKGKSLEAVQRALRREARLSLRPIRHRAPLQPLVKGSSRTL